MPVPQDFWNFPEFLAKKKVWDQEQLERRAKAAAIVDAEDAVRRAAEERAAEAAREAARGLVRRPAAGDGLTYPAAGPNCGGCRQRREER